jgi:N-acetylglutamate synthase-like GNAT family acetyltransferase
MVVREIGRNEIERIKEIDRSEVIDHIYYFKDGKLILKKEHYDISGWDLQELRKNLSHIYEVCDRHGTLFGSFIDGKMVGVGVLDSKFFGKDNNQIQLYFLHVSKDYRKRGIGKELFNYTVRKACELGAKKLYISATPSKSTVEFYMNLGCVLATELEKSLFEQEPEDIHLEYVL